MKFKLFITSSYAYTFLLLLTVLTFIPVYSHAADIGNCLMCHKYPGLSRVNQDGKLRLMYVNENIFTNSVHAKVKCEGCHTDITKIPHEPAKKVDCLSQCHIIEPSSEKKFSHRDAEEYLTKSVHGKFDKNGNQKKFTEDFPSCKNCHDNPLFRPISFNKRVRPGISEAAIGRCRVCHKKDEFIYRFYNHVTTRLRRSRNPKNIAEMCARCHDNTEIVGRHDLSTRAAFSYGESYHGKAASFLDERIPDCLDCHVNPGKSIHQILSHNDPESAVHENNKSNICSSMDCHPGASEKLADYKVHAEFNLAQNPVLYYFTVGFIGLTGGTLLPLMGIIFLDLLRRLFPNAALRKEEE